MNIRHHPSEALLLDYASGAQGEAWSLAVATHLALCPACRSAVGGFEAVGGNLVEEIAPVAVNDNALAAVMARIDAGGGEPDSATPSIELSPVPAGRPVLPQPLRGYLGADADGLAWRRLGLGAWHLPIPTGEPGATARLLRIPAGKPVPQHGHRGMELTLVLAGAFSDVTGEYGRGDLQEADSELEHQPHAASGEDCICLAVTDAPLRFSGMLVRMVQPLLGI